MSIPPEAAGSAVHGTGLSCLRVGQHRTDRRRRPSNRSAAIGGKLARTEPVGGAEDSVEAR
ncbi:MAG TPA: hypothetical protein VFO77_10665, partial [Actinoplanes sp.]|nr:hypothetical protein [Actinoplanes sp.]